MSGTLPTTPRPRSAILRSLTPTLVSEAQSLGRQVRSRGAHAWLLTLSYPPAKRATFDPLYAFLVAQRGQYEAFTVTVPDRTSPKGIGTGSPVVRLRQNLLTYSDDFSNAAWAKNGSPTQGTSAPAASPDATDMQEWHRGTTGGSTSLSQASGVFTGLQVLSVYLKANDAGRSRINLYDATAAVSHSLDIVWTAGVGAADSPTNVDASGVDAIGGGVYRAWIAVNGTTRSILGNGRSVYLYPSVDAALNGCYLWRAQLEAGYADPGYRLQTVAAAVTGEALAARTLYTDGWTASQTGILKAGDLLKLAGHTKVYLVTADSNSDARGNAALTIEPALRAAVVDAEEITVSNVPMTVRLQADTMDAEVDRQGFYAPTIELVEVV